MFSTTPFQTIDNAALSQPLEALMDRLKQFQGGTVAEREKRLYAKYSADPYDPTPVPDVGFPIMDR